ncbi:MAG: DEAD/DEAH box helicase [Rikenellaceae bacterium]
MTSFTSLGIAADIASALSRCNICDPLPIQQAVIPKALCGNNLLVCSQTGSGKTLTYLLPLIEQIRNQQDIKIAGVQALILAPTRELAQQIGHQCNQLCQMASLRCTTIVGGVEYEPQRQALASHPEIIISTPGRLLDLLEQQVTSISGLRHLVIDEVDQMLDLGFKEPITSLAQLRAPSAQTLCFSATLPLEVIEIINSLATNIEQITLEDQPLAVPSIEHRGYYVSFEMMDPLLLHLLRELQPPQAIIFTRSRKMADRIVELLSRNKFEAEAIHSDRSQSAREHILERFRTSQTSILVATDVIARGIDIESITHIFNFGLPQNAEQYIHRCGRTGRAGRSGVAISLISPQEKEMVGEICRLMKRHIVIDWSHPYLTPDISQALSTSSQQKKRRGKSRR